MTRKDYETIASAIRNVVNTREAEGFGLTTHPSVYAEARQYAMALASALSRDNPRFSREMFLKACGLPLPLFYAD